MPKNHLMGELKTRILPLFRRSSGSSARSTTNSSLQSAADIPRTRSKASLVSRVKPSSLAEPVPEEQSSPQAGSFHPSQLPADSCPTDNQAFERPPTPPKSPLAYGNEVDHNPHLTVEDATPEDNTAAEPSVGLRASSEPPQQLEKSKASKGQPSTLSSRQRFLKTLSESHTAPSSQIEPQDYFGTAPVLSPNMLQRKIWVKRIGASATLVQIDEDDLVDDARDNILRKYANSLGRTFDSPDVTIRIVPREGSQHGHGIVERNLGPEESINRTLDTYYPGGQTVNEALIIEVPHRRTPRHSPRVYADNRPPENGADYFPVMPVALNPSPHLQSVPGNAGPSQPVHALSVLTTGQVPPLPSPGASSRPGRHGGHRPKIGRTSTSSPTILTNAVPHPETRQLGPPTPSATALPTPPLPPAAVSQQKASTPPARVSSPRPSKISKTKKNKKASVSQAPIPTSLLDGGVPPINVLIVEDNIINLKLLEAFMKRLKVRWHTAMNGRDAVTKWRAGGFHLVLMDIQLPVMNGLDATKEIRRLERVNGIGVFADKVEDKTDSGRTEEDAKAEGKDQLQNPESFKSPVIIVALTASSLQSDRHEALAAGCNDFLTKPVNFVWLERKVMEWGCMQALIDFDGWRKWKDFSQLSPVSSKKNSDALGTTKPSATILSGSVLPARGRESASNSNSTGSSDSALANVSSIPDTLTALNAKSESADTLDSVSTTGSNSSAETAAPLASSTATLTPQGSFHRQLPPQPLVPHSLRPSTTETALASSKQHLHLKQSGPIKEERRRKRSSLGHGGLTGVVEEMEDGDINRRGLAVGR